MDRDSIIRDFEDYIDKYQLDYSEIYVGITNDVERRLFQEHQVPKDHYWWIYSPADNNDIARKVEQDFISKGCQGGSGGGDDSSNIVYAYKTSSITNP